VHRFDRAQYARPAIGMSPDWNVRRRGCRGRVRLIYRDDSDLSPPLPGALFRLVMPGTLTMPTCGTGDQPAPSGKVRTCYASLNVPAAAVPASTVSAESSSGA
jgi:hypothetical protein